METVANLMIKGTPAYAKDYPVWIVRVDELAKDGAWFFGAYETEEYAQQIITDIHRAIIVKPGDCSSLCSREPFADFLAECQERLHEAREERLPFMETREQEVELDGKINTLKWVIDKMNKLI